MTRSNLILRLEKIFVFRAIYVSAEHGPYEESDGDPTGVYIWTPSSNFEW